MYMTAPCDGWARFEGEEKEGGLQGGCIIEHKDGTHEMGVSLFVQSTSPLTLHTLNLSDSYCTGPRQLISTLTTILGQRHTEDKVTRKGVKLPIGSE